jgi:hypothetical protein
LHAALGQNVEGLPVSSSLQGDDLIVPGGTSVNSKCPLRR